MCRRLSVWIWKTGYGRKRKFASEEATRTSCACPRLTTCRGRILTGFWMGSTSIRSRRRSSRRGGSSPAQAERSSAPAAAALSILRIRASAITAPCLSRHRTLLCLGAECRSAKSGCLRGRRLRQSLGMKGGYDSRRILVDHREQRAGWSFWRAASAFPMLNRIETEAEGVGKARLSHVELVADAFHIHLIRHMHLEAFPLSCKKSLNLEI